MLKINKEIEEISKEVKERRYEMSIFGFIVVSVLMIIFHYLIIMFEIKSNPDLFYALYCSDIDCILRKYDKKRCKKILQDKLKEFNIEFIDKDDVVSWVSYLLVEFIWLIKQIRKENKTMFESVDFLIKQFLDYLPQWTLIYIVLGVIGSIVFSKR